MTGTENDIRLAAAGDTRAYERLYREHVARVHGLARRMIGPEEADDLTQEVFVRAWEKLDTFRGDAAFGTWLHRVAINLLLTRARSRKRHGAWIVEDEEAVEWASVEPPPQEDSMDLEAALERLPEGARRVFVLHDVEGYRHEEIAEMLDLAVGTSKSQLHRARMLLRQHLAA
ncbi:MAG: RNA polymerase sigma factor [Gemmatimonadota bacterium]